jgi:lipopolysaccharide/colanic/teichoic acid biosynthesis glycosyltransferase
MMKRLFDALAAAIGLAITSPLLLVVAVAIWLQDFSTPFYIARRAAPGGGTFWMVKFRSMVANAEKIGGSSTAVDDPRITPVGRFVRAHKLDELVQLWNVLRGDMSLVGPRPQVVTDTAMYTQEEKRLLNVRPGITDLASIVFADEGEILSGSKDPDLAYNQIIRPWKSRLALLYLDHRTFLADLEIILLTALTLVSRPAALWGVQRILARWRADMPLRNVARREQPLSPYPPPGVTECVME